MCPHSGSLGPGTQGPVDRGGFKGGGSRSGLVLPFFFVPFWDFPDFSWIFPICPGIVRGFPRFVIFLCFGSFLTAPTRSSPERVRDTIRTFPEKNGKLPLFGNPLIYLLSRNVKRHKQLCKKNHKISLQRRQGSSPELCGHLGKPCGISFLECPHLSV